MYLMRTKKQLEQEENKELLEKRERLLEKQFADVGRTQDSAAAANAGKSPTKKNVQSDPKDLRIEDLPDGACYRPKSVLQSDGKGDTAIKSVEYIGSFSVTGADPNERAECVQKQLEQMRNSTKSKKVLLVISLSGIKVCSSDGESVYMAHALKRISYATCDPDFCQFSFLAREPKANLSMQFCHAFVTSTKEEAEELNAIVGNAFKMAYAQEREKQPTFNELIEQQLIQQKAKFQEYQEQAQKVFQQKLAEIATPTPYSEKAMQHMEMRRQSSSDDSQPSDKDVGSKNKIWFSLQRSPAKAKHAVDKVKHRSPMMELAGLAPIRSESPSRSSSRPGSEALNNNARLSDPTGAALKRNSTPITSNSPLSILRGSIDTSGSPGKSKGSPVTALKDAIDRGYLTNGNVNSADVQDPEGYLKPQNNNKGEDKISTNMVNRPLPAIPAQVNGHTPTQNGHKDYSPRHNMNRNSKCLSEMDTSPKHERIQSPRHKGTPKHNGHINSPQKHKNWSSVDDNVLIPEVRKRDRLNDSPRRKPVRPMSEVFTDSKSAATNLYGDRQNQFEVSSYMYSRGQMQFHIHDSHIHTSHSQGQISGQQVKGHGQNQGNRRRGEETRTNQKVILRYQNDSPFQEVGSYENPAEEGGSASQPKPPGLESLMGLDRSHIEDETLRHSSWYQAGIPREIALEILQQEEIGSFIVRDSSTHPGCYALSVRVPKFENPTGISHYLILKTQRGVKLKGLEKEWPDLLALVTHHTVMAEMLPCTLRLPHKSKNPAYKDSEDGKKEDDPDYQRLSDFTSMMAALKN
ncbi:uncharacterized protein LOC133206410 isoform X2 [Saccostrea echinata]|uniref:uncharacterized protein LOC133206410 isoform X2 n=1 Tax=Saccostrea echinata TaxID=191078 RepID=UPI002A82BCC3|nr:uncharacterized protein LOC133206410 isoform X2 [Saccostrea echinata]